jgi:hypothetical protein
MARIVLMQRPQRGAKAQRGRKEPRNTRIRRNEAGRCVALRFTHPTDQPGPFRLQILDADFWVCIKEGVTKRFDAPKAMLERRFQRDVARLDRHWQDASATPPWPLK